MTTHWPSNIYGEEILRWAWWLFIILVVVWGMDCGSRLMGGKWHSPRWVVFPGFFYISGCFSANASSDRRSKARWGCVHVRHYLAGRRGTIKSQ